MHQRRGPSSSGIGGFTLLEVMIALGVFAIGFIAVASIFPVAALLQRNTMADVHARAYARNVEAVLYARGFEQGKVDAAIGGQAQTVRRMSSADLDEEYSLLDRSHGSSLTLADRTVFWIPLFYADDPAGPVDARGYRVYVFVVRGRQGATTYPADSSNDANYGDSNRVPKVRYTTIGTGALPAGIRAGDRVVDNEGRPWIVENDVSGNPTINWADPPEGIWYVHPGTANDRPYVDLLVLAQDDPSKRLIRP